MTDFNPKGEPQHVYDESVQGQLSPLQLARSTKTVGQTEAKDSNLGGQKPDRAEIFQRLSLSMTGWC